MSLQILISFEVWRGVVKGILFSTWIVGSLIVTSILLKLLFEQFRQRRRFRMFEAGHHSIRLSSREIPIVKRFADMIEMADLKVPVEIVMAIMLVFMLSGFFGSYGMIYILQQEFAVGLDRVAETHAWFPSVFVGVLMSSLPFFIVRFRVQRKQHRIANRMIMLVQNLIGYYRPQITIAEMIVKASSTMPGEVRSEWRRLELSLHLQSIKDALLEFSRRLDNEWADDLSDILLIGAQYGMDISSALQKLVRDMQTAKRNEEKRLAMVTVYRIGISIMVVFAFVIVYFNIYADGANYRHYFMEPAGKFILVVSIIILFLSMVQVLRVGRKRF